MYNYFEQLFVGSEAERWGILIIMITIIITLGLILLYEISKAPKQLEIKAKGALMKNKIYKLNKIKSYKASAL